MSPLPTRIADHWWQRPGRLPGRELYHWHMLFHDQPEVHELAAMAQQRLAGLPGLDYSHACGPAAPIIEALGPWLPKTEITLGSISLVAQTQVGRSWQWRQTAELQLSGTSVTPSPSPDDAASEPVHAPRHWWWRG
jgi:hypothetical protein